MKIHRVISLLLALVLAVLCAGCKENNEPTDVTGEKTTAQTVESGTGETSIINNETEENSTNGSAVKGFRIDYIYNFYKNIPFAELGDEPIPEKTQWKPLYEIEYDADGVELDRDIYSYDSKGNLISHEMIYPDGTVNSKEEYRYNEKGYLISYRLTDPDWMEDSGSTKLEEYIEYTYDDLGRLKESEHVEHDFKTHTVYIYDKEGRLSEEQTDEYSKNADVDEWKCYRHQFIYYKYDSNGSLIEKLWKTDDPSETVDKTEYKYDANGNVIRKDNYYAYANEDFELYSYRIFEYNQNNMMVKSLDKLNSESEPAYIREYVYDEYNNIIKEGSIKLKYDFKSENNVIRRSKNYDDSIVITEYKRFS